MQSTGKSLLETTVEECQSFKALVGLCLKPQWRSVSHL